MSKDKQVESDEEAPAEWLGEASLIHSYLDRKLTGCLARPRLPEGQ